MIGTILLDRYKIDSELGKGGMGVVYKAHDTLLHRAVAIKFLNTVGVGTEGKSRLIQEARAVAQLNHPNIVSVFDAGETDGNPFIVMELVQGNTLKGIATPSISEALVMAAQICKALDHAHSKGIIHRDLKLENIIVTDSQTLKLMDFGLARSSDDSRMTEEGVLKGTLAYVAPELIQGEPASAQSDLYAFGVILYELLTGHAPFQGTMTVVLSQHLNGIVTPPSEHNQQVPAWVDSLVLQLLAKRPEERPASAKDVLLILEGQSASPIISITPRPKNNLPSQLTTFIGREKEVEQIKKRLEKNHLVTLTGSGGIGKTRLSIQVASELITDYPIGVWLVELAPLTDPALVPQSVCAALGVTPEGNTSALDALIDYLRAKKILLVVDNCEHLIDACAQLCDSLLHACDDLRIITSSREALGIKGENAYRVPSLSLPNPKSGLHVIEESEAVKLFMERAATILPEFELIESNAPAIAQICQRLDGIALAIELAASRVKMLKVEEIAARLDDRFRLLTGGSRTALPRQQTLRAMIDWSYDLLSENERLLLRRLAVFAGSWSLELAEQVCSDEKIDPYEVLDMLGKLVDKSLVAVTEGKTETRYRMLETVRQYAREKLFESGEGDKVRDQHLKTFMERAEKAEPEIRSFNQLIWLDRLEAEIDNLHTALEWSQERDNESFLRLASALWRFWSIRGQIADLEWLPQALSATQNMQTILRARALGRAAVVSTSGGDLSNSQLGSEFAQEAVTLSRAVDDKVSLIMALISQNYLVENSQRLALLDEALLLTRGIGDQWLAAFVLRSRAELFAEQNDLASAQSIYEEALKEARGSGDRRVISSISGCLGDIFLFQGNTLQAEKTYWEALAGCQEMKDYVAIRFLRRSILDAKIFQEDYVSAKEMIAEDFRLVQPGNKASIALTFFYLATTELAEGNVLLAIEQMEEGLALAKQTKEQDIIVRIILGLGEALRRKQDLTQAKINYEEAIAICQKQNFTWHYCDCLEGLGMAAIDQGRVAKGARLLGAWETMRTSVFTLEFPFMVRERESHIAAARAQLSEDEFNQAWAEGKAMSTEEAVKFALEESQ
jgi:non-specific serine/threonine protein kinase